MSEIQRLLLDKINNNQSLIDNWFEEKFSAKNSLIYNSVDLRHSGFKIVPVDNNCFPAGFNNLNKDSQHLASEFIHEFFSKNHSNVKKILLIPENHTRNLKYLENVLVLKSIIENSGKIKVEIGSLIEDLDDDFVIDLEENHQIKLHKLIRKNDKITTKSNFEADLIISNNDFTSAPEAILHNIYQEIIPSTDIGWHKRTKSRHFDIYENLASELASLLDIDVWLINAFHKNCKNINFKNKNNIDNLANLVSEILLKIKEKYKEYEIADTPYCYVKADSGTYGMAMMTIQDAGEILQINKKQRNKMNMIKGNIVNHKVIIQEGVKTIDTVNKIIAEPMIYLVDGKVVGNLYRNNDQRDNNISLNSAGMLLGDMRDILDKNLVIGGEKKDIFKIYNVVARLSSLAAAHEINYKSED